MRFAPALAADAATTFAAMAGAAVDHYTRRRHISIISVTVPSVDRHAYAAGWRLTLRIGVWYITLRKILDITINVADETFV